MNFPIKHKSFKSFDGTKIGYQVMGKGKKDIVLCNGLGGTAIAWSPLYNHFGNDYRFITWDYRGLFRSDCPEDEKNLTIQDHVRDLEVLLAKEKISKALVGGWSMGVQVALEFYRHHPKKCLAMLFLNGTYGYPFDTALSNPLAKYILPKINELAHDIVPAVQPTIRPLANMLIDWHGFVKLITTLGLVHKNVNMDIFKEVAKEMISADLQMYHKIMKHLGEHDASDVLPAIRVPSLIIAGDEDKITPLRTAEKMAEDIETSEFFIIPRGTHYSILEFPEMIQMRVDKFLKHYYPLS